MAKPACECTTAQHWDITYVSKSPSDGEVIAIEIRCSKHKVHWWWKIEMPLKHEELKENVPE